MCSPTSSGGHVQEVLRVADDALRRARRRAARRAARRTAGAARDRVHQREQADGQADRAPSRRRRAAAPSTRRASPMRCTLPLASCVAGVRAAAGDDRADRQDGRGDGDGDPREPARAHRRAARRRGAASRAAATTAAKVTAMIAIDSRKCSATSHGLRSVSTVMPPSTACAGMPSERQRRQPALASLRASATSQVATAIDDEDEGQLPVGELDDAVDARTAGSASASARCSAARSGSPARSRSAARRRR